MNDLMSLVRVELLSCVVSIYICSLAGHARASPLMLLLMGGIEGPCCSLVYGAG